MRHIFWEQLNPHWHQTRRLQEGSVLFRVVEAIRKSHPAEKSPPRLHYPQLVYYTQDVFSVAFSRHLKQQPAAWLKAPLHATEHGFLVNNPMKRSIRKRNVKFTLKSQLSSIHHLKRKVRAILPRKSGFCQV